MSNKNGKILSDLSKLKPTTVQLTSLVSKASHIFRADYILVSTRTDEGKIIDKGKAIGKIDLSNSKINNPL